ncbi:Aldo-keto reductase family 1 member [Wickerhamomyces ciferrii]|uniref:Aldo-keto reductase family 1 member n=1 Tax=Wickerhamomyces ciferrii (strain ATCC 14091 / BCRC 22168 / CBS 111 / JCM 3599 / NBRC 0793 / NRRL Y-1031 F-60-10) TaxID=1206466 RepID=K0KM82_WICCF|nr:Aldo-keto reductase family 1 member [Wickerhamomyces ciferrii]CCH43292.1 Aldo-keto reductase family 1 member [Wickerhamomyces ciferrii]
MASQLVSELNKTKFGLGLMTFTINNPPRTQDQFNEVVLATIKKNLPAKTFVNGGEFYGPDDLNLKYIKSFVDTHPEQRQNLIISIKGAFDFVTLKPTGDKKGIDKSIDHILEYIPDLDTFEQARIDPTLPLEESIDALNEAVDQGKIKGISFSEINEKTLEKAAKLVKTPIVSVEVEFSIFSRDILKKGGLAEKAGALGVPIIAYSPLSRGLLTGDIKSAADVPKDMRSHLDRFTGENLEHNLKIVEYIQQKAEEAGTTIVEYALAWVRAWSGRTVDGVKYAKIIDIPSTSTLKRVDQNFSDFVLTEEQFDEANKFLETVTVKGRRYNEAFEKYLDL